MKKIINRPRGKKIKYIDPWQLDRSPRKDPVDITEKKKKSEHGGARGRTVSILPPPSAAACLLQFEGLATLAGCEPTASPPYAQCCPQLFVAPWSVFSLESCVTFVPVMASHVVFGWLRPARLPALARAAVRP